VWGDLTSNVLKNSVWSHCYRTNTTDTATAHTRPIMAVTGDIEDTLPAGTYWVEFTAAGSMGSGPWAVPIDTLGATVTGNALQYQVNTWTAVVDGGAAAAQGFPFLIRGYK
jgi:hypothetical protein